LLIDQLKSEQGQVVLLSGEAGIGKSRLVAEAKTYAMAHDALLFQGNCFPADRSFPYAPLLDLFRSHFIKQATIPVAENVKLLLSELSRLLPELALRFLELVSAPANPQADPEQEKRRLFAIMTHFFLGQAAQHPVLLVVEDLHWCDDLSLEFLLHLARHCQHVPLLLLLTYRHDELQPALRQWLSDMNRERLAQEFALEHLSRAEVAAMLRATLEIKQGTDADLLDTISTRSEGNPFFVEELLTSLVAAGALVCVDGAWKLTTQQAPVPRSV
jgi:predicted ATPase